MGDIWQCVETVLAVVTTWAEGKHLQFTGQPRTTKTYLAQNVSGA